MIDLKATFEKFDDEFLKADRIPPERRTSTRDDLTAFMLLDRLVPGTRDILGSAEHDEVFIDVDVEALAAVATEEDVLTLVRCGVRYNEEYDSLAMFV